MNEALVLREPAADLAQDVAVAAHAGQRAESAGSSRTRHDRAQPRDELLWDEGLGHVVVRAGQKVLDLVLQRVPHRQEHDRDETRPKVFAELGHDLIAGHVAEHQVEQDDVGTPLDGGVVRGAAFVDSDALEARALEHALDETQHLVVVIDHQCDVTVDQRRMGPLWFGSDPSGDCHDAGLPLRGPRELKAQPLSLWGLHAEASRSSRWLAPRQS